MSTETEQTRTPVRTRQILLKLTEAEDRALSRVASLAGDTKSGYLRRALYAQPEFVAAKNLVPA